MAAHSSSQLLNGQLAALEAPLSDDSLHALALVVGPAMLLEALDLIDQDQGTTDSPLAAVGFCWGESCYLGMLSLNSVARIMPPNGRPLYQVASSSGGQPYTVFPHVPAGTGYCPCPAYSFGVLAKGNQVTVTTHLLSHLALPHPDLVLRGAVQTPTRMSHRGPDRRLGEQTRRPRVARRPGHQIRRRRPTPARGKYRSRLRLIRVSSTKGSASRAKTIEEGPNLGRHGTPCKRKSSPTRSVPPESRPHLTVHTRSAPSSPPPYALALRRRPLRTPTAAAS